MTFETIKKVLLDLGVDEERIHADAYLHKDLELDSMETVQIALDLKRLCGVTVKFESRQDLTVADVCALVDQTKDAVFIPTDVLIDNAQMGKAGPGMELPR